MLQELSNLGYICQGSTDCECTGLLVDGECGPANGGTFAEAPPTDQLCRAGAPDGEPEESGNQWHWICEGINNGNNSPLCRATVEEEEEEEESQCTQNGGQCVPGDTCSSGSSLQYACPGAGTQTCCPVDAPGPGPTPGTGSAVISFENPLKYDTVQEFVSAVLTALQGIIVLLSIVFIVIGAVMYITSAGNEGMVKLAKGAILASMIGLAIGIAAPTFLKEIYDLLEVTSEEVEVPEEVANATPIDVILMNTLNFLLAIVGVLAIIMLVIGGIMYLLAGGDQNRIDAGKKIVIFSIVGLTVALAALILVRQVANFFG